MLNSKFKSVDLWRFYVIRMKLELVLCENDNTVYVC